MTEQGYWQRHAAARGLSRRTFLRTSAITGVGAAALLVGCGDSSDDTPAGTATAAGTTAPGGTTAPTGTAEPMLGVFEVPGAVRGGTMLQDARDPTVGWDPHNSISYLMGYVVEPLSIKLVRHDYREGWKRGSEDSLIGELAESWESPDPLTYNFTLREGLNWPDQEPMNGRAMTASDVAYTLNHAILPDSIVQTYVFDAVAGATAIDDRTVQVKLNYPYWLFPNLMDSYNSMILPDGIYDWAGPDGMKNADNSRGGGPWLLDRFEPGSRVLYKPNPSYQEFFGIPYADELSIKIQKGSGPIMQSFLAKQIHKMTIAGGQLANVQENRPDAMFNIDVYAPTSTNAIFMNTLLAPFDDVRVRRAMSMAIDRKGWGDTMGFEYKLESGPITHGYPDWKKTVEQMPADVSQWVAFNPAEATKLLAAAGVSGDTAFDMHMYPYNESYTPEAQLLIDQLNDVGMTLELRILEYNNWISTVYYGEYEGTMYGPDNLDRIPQQLSTRLLASGNRNHSHVTDPEVQQWLLDFNGAAGAEDAKVIANKLQEKSMDQAYAVYRPQAQSPQAWDPALQNWNGEVSIYYADAGYRPAYLWLDA